MCHLLQITLHYIVHCSNQRQHYWDNRVLAMQQPRRYLSIIIDGMDHQKLSVPHYTGWRKPKSLHTVQPVGLTSVKIHTPTPQIHHYMDVLQYPHDPNLTMNVLLHSISRIGNHLPPTLFIQLDNCYRENKNYSFLGVCALLVYRRHVQDIQINFCLTGHTHEDIDQVFSVISDKLKRYRKYILLKTVFPYTLHAAFSCTIFSHVTNDIVLQSINIKCKLFLIIHFFRDSAKTLLNMRNNILSSTGNPEPSIHLLGQLFDIKRWMSPFVNSINGISKAHHFW